MILNKPTRFKRSWIIGAILLLLIIFGVALSLTLLNADWLKTQVEKYAHEKYQTDINIESLEFNPWKRHALLSDITLERTEQDRNVAAFIEFIEIDFQIIPLIFHDIVIDKLLISQPNLRIDVQRKPELVPEKTLTRLEKVMDKLIGEFLLDPLIVSINEVMEIFVGSIDNKIEINELIVNECRISYMAKRLEAAPFTLDIQKLNYSANNINARMPLDFATNADITAIMVLGEAQSDFSQRFSEKPFTLSINNIDIGYLDKYLKQKDILQINKGNGNVKFLLDDKMVLAKISLHDLELLQNIKAIHKDFAFIPVEKLINYVNQADGKLYLEFEIEKRAVRTSQDLKFCVTEVWKGMQKQLLKKVSSEKLMNFFDKREKTSQTIKSP